MSHFAKVENGSVTQVIVAEQDFIDSGAVGDPALWIKTSYNTRNNVHYDPITGQPDNGIALRGNYASIGYIYNQENDVFYPQKPFASWLLSKDSWSWIPPIPMPLDGNIYSWDEINKSWVIVPKMEI